VSELKPRSDRPHEGLVDPKGAYVGNVGPFRCLSLMQRDRSTFMGLDSELPKRILDLRVGEEVSAREHTWCRLNSVELLMAPRGEVTSPKALTVPRSLTCILEALQEYDQTIEDAYGEDDNDATKELYDTLSRPFLEGDFGNYAESLNEEAS